MLSVVDGSGSDIFPSYSLLPLEEIIWHWTAFKMSSKLDYRESLDVGRADRSVACVTGFQFMSACFHVTGTAFPNFTFAFIRKRNISSCGLEL